LRNAGLKSGAAHPNDRLAAQDGNAGRPSICTKSLSSRRKPP